MPRCPQRTRAHKYLSSQIHGYARKLLRCRASSSGSCWDRSVAVDARNCCLLVTTPRLRSNAAFTPVLYLCVFSEMLVHAAQRLARRYAQGKHAVLLPAQALWACEKPVALSRRARCKGAVASAWLHHGCAVMLLSLLIPGLRVPPVM